MLESTSAGGIARRLQLRSENSRSWMAIVKSTDDQDEREAFAGELSALIAKAVRHVEAHTLTKESLRRLLRKPSDDVVIIFASAFDCQIWKVLDLKRSMMERVGPILFWLDYQDLELLTDCAPNLKSYIGVSVFRNDPDVVYMTENEKLARLAQLRIHFGKSDKEIVESAEMGMLEGTPSNTEWLILLGRSDLVRDTR